ncbi:MAG: hypothetical protein JWM35_56, partial [Verrucomicrobia bacterium]|nr:hypothetical protein [Verrucomicrobiota bacterium]
LTPCLTRHLLAGMKPGATLCYLDADLLFFESPAPIWRALDSGSILVVQHRYPKWHDDSGLYGRFNVGVLGFRNDANGRACLEWWRVRCLESCALTSDATHYGDQKYLDEWPGRFEGVVDLKHPGVNLAPWNWAAQRITERDNAILVDGEPLVVFHFAQFRRISDRWFDSGQLEYGIMPRRIRSRIYGDYWDALIEAEAVIRRQRPGFSIPRRGWGATLGAWHLALLRLFWGQFWFRTNRSWWSARLGLGRWSGHAMGHYRRIKRQRS